MSGGAEEAESAKPQATQACGLKRRRMRYMVFVAVELPGRVRDEVSAVCRAINNRVVLESSGCGYAFDAMKGASSPQ
jgi:hypothetical protein